MFASPEYASYIALCRDLRLERDLRPGDYYAALWAGFTKWQIRIMSTLGLRLGSDQQIGFALVGANHLPDLREAGGTIWLPRLDQWLAMLEETGLPNVFFIPKWAAGEFIGDPGTGLCGEGPTREEAAARLWMAVGKPSPAPAER